MGKTITIYLIDGNPQGAQSVSISNKICQMLMIPRASLSIIIKKKKEELQNPAFYILLGEEDDFQQPRAYLGETENFIERIKNHCSDNKKTFWQKVLVFVSMGGTMTKADVQFLEHLAFTQANKAKRYNIVENKQSPKAPNLPEHQTDSMQEFFEDVKVLTSFVRCNIFEIVVQKDEHIFSSKYRGCDAKGFYNEVGFTVLRGSKLAKDTVPKFAWKEKRQKMVEEFATKKVDSYILNHDKTFSSPSTAADFCLGSSNNGWIIWKDKNGQTLDEVYRKKLND
jgi:predicted GIY-YIG superfamily endonuclease